MPWFSVVVDFVGGEVTGFGPASEAIVEFIQEDRVAAADDLAMVMAEALAYYLVHGEVSQPHLALLAENVVACQ